jgi:hypothetical protein
VACIPDAQQQGVEKPALVPVFFRYRIDGVEICGKMREIICILLH